MYTDIAGFSSIMYSDPKLADEIRSRHSSIFADAHSKYNGKLVQQFGDSTMSIFDSAAEAVECAYFLQLELRRPPEIPVRIGIHTGEIVQDERGAYGEGLKIASRIERMSEPGSIYLTAKAYDDVKNHPWITAQSLGFFKLDDLRIEYELFVINNRGLHTPRVSRSEIEEMYPVPPDAKADAATRNEYVGKKSKVVTGFLALFMVHAGAHRFYLGQRLRGFLYILASAILLIISIEEHAPFLLLMLIVGLVDAVLFWVMPTDEFDLKFNKRGSIRAAAKTTKAAKKENAVNFKLMKEAVRKFEGKQYEKAITILDKVLDREQQDPAAHFYLACCFSMLRDTDDAFFHLEQAASSGFSDMDRIEEDRALRFVRSQPRYQTFRQAFLGAPIPSLASPSYNIFDHQPEQSALEKIEDLGEKLARGELSAAQFEEEKIKILKY